MKVRVLLSTYLMILKCSGAETLHGKIVSLVKRECEDLSKILRTHVSNPSVVARVCNLSTEKSRIVMSLWINASQPGIL